jgi:hypothetical protein
MTQTSERPAKSINSPFRTLSDTEPSAISIEVIPLDSNADSSIAVTEAGIRNRFNDLQRQKAPELIVVSLDGGSNMTD